MLRAYFLFCILHLSAQLTIELPYGLCQIDEPTLEAIIEDPVYQRLKKIHQYGISHYNQTPEEYSRFEHSVGVYMLLNKENVPYLEQVSGLLHDVSHTAFSHFGDYYFQATGDEGWQDMNHNRFLEKSGLKNLLEAQGFDIEAIYHKNAHFTALERPLPYLCADRIEYNLQGAYKHKLISHLELLKLYQDVHFREGQWSFSNIELAEKLANSCIYMMETIWSAPLQYVSNLVLCKLITHALARSYLTLDRLMSQPDTAIMACLESSNDQFIDQGLKLIRALPSLILEGDKFHFCYKCRAIDPLIRTEGGYQVLSALSTSYQKRFQEAKARAKKGVYFSIAQKDLEQYRPYFTDLIALQSASRL